MCKCTPQKHAAVIKAWADGSKVQYKQGNDGTWIDAETPTWVDWLEYRIKPETKPDVVRYFDFSSYRPSPSSYSGTADQTKYDNVKATWDGETGKLKSVEIIK